MSNRVILDIVPQRIEPGSWHEAYDEARHLLLGDDRIAGVERDRDDATARRLCVAGERNSLATGECHTVYRDLGRYTAQASTPEGFEPALDDILFAALEAPAAPEPPGPGGGLARVLGDAASSPSYTVALLAAAMVFEARFPRHAMVHGEFDREQVEAAWDRTAGVLGRSIVAPMRVDAPGLAKRLGARLEGHALLSAVERLYIAPPERRDADLLRIPQPAEAESWFLGKLREHADPIGVGAQWLLAGYLERTRELAGLCRLACNDPRGPKYAPAALAEALAPLRRCHGATGALLGRPGGLLDVAPIERALAVVFGADAQHLAEVFRRRDRAEASLATELDELATLPSPGDLTPVQAVAPEVPEPEAGAQR